MKESERAYFVPVNVNTRFEILPGFGLKELFLCGIAAAIGGALALLAGAFALTPAARFVLAAVPPSAVFIAGRPAGSGGESLLDLFRHFRDWGRRRKLRLNMYEGGE